MKIRIDLRFVLISILSILSLDAVGQANGFMEDLNFLNQFTDLITLKSSDNQQQIIITPEYQGRIMTSTATGKNGKSHGWINYSFIESQKTDPNINPFGGIDRLWLGPLGSQFSLYYQGKEFDDKYWHVPHDFDRKPFEVVEKGKDFVVMQSEMKFMNFIKTPFHIQIERRVNLFSADQIENNLGVKIPSTIHAVGYESINTMTNLDSDWDFEKGTLALWSLAQIQGNDNTAIIIPINNKDDFKLNEYLADIPKDRLVVHDNYVLFRGDGKFRSKICTPPQITTPLFGALDLENKVLTIIQFQFENGTQYFNSDLGYQEDPYEGDVISIYNNGPETIDGKSQHSFYELESASALKALKSHKEMTHFHRTYNFEGDEASLFQFVKSLLGAGDAEIRQFIKQKTQ